MLNLARAFHQCTSHTGPLLHIYKGPSWSGVGAFQKYSINMGFRHKAKTRQFFMRWGEGGPFALSTSEPVFNGCGWVAGWLLAGWLGR